MGYLDGKHSPIYLDAKITNLGRKKIAQGDFDISYFQVGDSEYDYSFVAFSGGTALSQKVLSPFDKDLTVKYPYKLSDSTTIVTYGNPISNYSLETVVNDMGTAGYVNSCTPPSVVCSFDEINITALSGTTALTVSDSSIFVEDSDITVALTQLGMNNIITGNATSYVYKIESVNNTTKTLTLDRATPDLNAIYSGQTIPISVINNDCNDDSGYTCETLPTYDEQQDAWDLNVVWTDRPIGFDDANKTLIGYPSNIYASSKEFFGYTSSDGQLTNISTTITNSFDEKIVVSPEEQHSLAIVHYSKFGDIAVNPDKFFKYDDYIMSDVDGVSYFEIYIPFLQYDRNTGTTYGAKFTMDTTNHYLNSAASGSSPNKVVYRYLIDEEGNNVGKIFVNHNIIIFDDQEIVATLDYNSNRKYTYPIPKLEYVTCDLKCATLGLSTNPLLVGVTTGNTYYVTYQFEHTGTTVSTIPCNHYTKISGTTQNVDLSIKFGANDFKYMMTELSGTTSGYVANKFYILYQEITDGSQPASDAWLKMDFTSEIPGHTVGDNIDPINLRNSRFIITGDDAVTYENTFYELSNLDNFGDSQAFPGGIKLSRGSDINVMGYFINLPTGDFTTSQNPTWDSLDNTNGDKMITEVGLYNSNYDLVVMGKASTPIKRTGTQVLNIKIDI